MMAADGLSNSAIARKLDVSNPTVTNGCRRYIANGIVGMICRRAIVGAHMMTMRLHA